MRNSIYLVELLNFHNKSLLGNWPIDYMVWHVLHYADIQIRTVSACYNHTTGMITRLIGLAKWDASDILHMYLFLGNRPLFPMDLKFWTMFGFVVTHPPTQILSNSNFDSNSSQYWTRAPFGTNSTWVSLVMGLEFC